MVDKVSNKPLWPTERKPKPKNLKQDEQGFSYTPNGSFYDMDDEYFNKNGYDVNGGWYTKEKEYIMGPDWISELGCYENEKEKYNGRLEDLDDEDEPDYPDFPDDGGLDDYDELNDQFDQLGIMNNINTNTGINNNGFSDNVDYEQILKEAEEYKAKLDKSNINTTQTGNKNNSGGKVCDSNITKKKNVKGTKKAKK